MSYRSGDQALDSYLAELEARINALQRGDQNSGTVSFGGTRIGDIHVNDNRTDAGGQDPDPRPGVRLHDVKTGITGFIPLPYGPELLFQWPTWAGALRAEESDQHHTTQPYTVLASHIITKTYSTPFTATVYVNGTHAIQTCTVTGPNQRFLTTPRLLTPYTDLVTILPSSPGTGNKGIMWHLELG